MARSVLRLGLALGVFVLPTFIACAGDDTTVEAPPGDIPSHQKLIDAHKKLSAKVVDLDARVQKLPKEARLSAFGAHVDALVAINLSMQKGSDQIATALQSGSATGGGGGLPSLDAGTTADAGFTSGFSGDGSVDLAILDAFASKIQEASEQIAFLRAQVELLAKEREEVRTEEASLRSSLEDLARANDAVKTENDAWFVKTAPKVVGRATIIGNLVAGGARTQRHRLSVALLPGPTKLTYVCKSEKGTPNVAVETSEGATKGAGTVTIDVNVAAAKFVDWKLVTDIPATCTVTIDTPSAATNEPALPAESVPSVHGKFVERSNAVAKLFDELAKIELGAKPAVEPGKPVSVVGKAAYLGAMRANLEDQLVSGYFALDVAAPRDPKDPLFAKQLAVMAFDTRIQAESEKIDVQMEEARRRAEAAMEAAEVALITSLVSAVIATSSSAVSLMGARPVGRKQ